MDPLQTTDGKTLMPPDARLAPEDATPLEKAMWSLQWQEGKTLHLTPLLLADALKLVAADDVARVHAMHKQAVAEWQPYAEELADAIAAKRRSSPRPDAEVAALRKRRDHHRRSTPYLRRHATSVRSPVTTLGHALATPRQTLA